MKISTMQYRKRDLDQIFQSINYRKDCNVKERVMRYRRQKENTFKREFGNLEK